MAVQQRQQGQQSEDYNPIEDVRLHWRQPKVVLSNVQSWITQQPVPVECLAATLAGSGQVSGPLMRNTPQMALYSPGYCCLGHANRPASQGCPEYSCRAPS